MLSYYNESEISSVGTFIAATATDIGHLLHCFDGIGSNVEELPEKIGLDGFKGSVNASLPAMAACGC